MFHPDRVFFNVDTFCITELCSIEGQLCSIVPLFYVMYSVADPGFPVGGGAPTSDVGVFLAKMHVKTKELDPVGGGAPVAPPPGSANGIVD